MSDATLQDQLLLKALDLLPVIAGAAIGLSGAALKYWVDRRERRKQAQRDRLEHFLKLAYDLKTWTDQLDDYYIFGTSKQRVPSPLEELEVLARLYFKTLVPEVDSIIVCAHDYKGICLGLAGQRVASGGKIPDGAADATNEAYKKLLAAIEALASKCAALSHDVA